MTGEVLLDTENLFRGFRPTPITGASPALQRLREETERVQRVVFGTIDGPGSDHAVERLGRLWDDLVDWFRADSGLEQLRGWSFGKLEDVSVRAFALALSDDEPGFARSIETGERRIPAAEWRESLLRFERHGVAVVHADVGVEAHAGERAMVAAFHRLRSGGDLRGVAASARGGSVPVGYLIGCGDRGGLFPIDHAVAAGEGALIRVVLPATSLGFIGQFGPGGAFRHLRPDQVALLPEIARDARLRRRHERVQAGRTRRHIVHTARRATAAVNHGDPLDEVVEHWLEASLGFDLELLERSAPGRSDWDAAIGEPLLVTPIRRALPLVATPGELDRIALGTLGRGRLRVLLDTALLLALFIERPAVRHSAVAAFLARTPRLARLGAGLPTVRRLLADSRSVAYLALAGESSLDDEEAQSQTTPPRRPRPS